MPFFDFHCHPALKPLLAPASANLTPWSDLRAQLFLGRRQQCGININDLFNRVLNSQSSLSQMRNSEVKLAGIVIYPVEANIAAGVLKFKIAANGNINVLDPAVLRQIAPGDHYYQWTCKTMDLLMQNSNAPGEVEPGFQFINRIDDYQPTANRVHGLLIFEGLHSFCNDPFSPTAQEDFETNFADFKLRYNTRIFAVNIPHMQPFPYATHAYGMQFLNKKLFYPTGKGFTDWGKQLINKMYDERILIDLKHMSYFSRTQLIAHRQENGYTDRPLICTHAGVTGISEKLRYKYLHNAPVQVGNTWQIFHTHPIGYLPYSSFNASSINLYDEEIVHILHSEGLIGISLDQRILGFPADNVAYNTLDVTPLQEEYISHEEAPFFFQGAPNIAAISAVTNFDHILTGDDASQHIFNLPNAHYAYFANQVLHILQIAFIHNIPIKKAATQICIGSDFDGLINAIDCCERVTEFTHFKNTLCNKLKTEKDWWTQLAFNKSELDIDELVEGIFFNNAHAFLKKNFN